MKKQCIRLLAVFLLCALLPAWALADQSGIPARLSQKIATRTGPSSAYDEPGTFLASSFSNAQVTVLTKAQGNGVWWLQIEFQDGGSRYRVYTGQKRVNVDISRVPEETLLGRGSMSAAGSVPGYYGPGPQYAPISAPVPWSVDVTVWGAENGYLLVDFFDDEAQTQRRAWVYAGHVDVQWHGARPSGSQMSPSVHIQPGALYHLENDWESTCRVYHLGGLGEESLIELHLMDYGHFGILPVTMTDRDSGVYTIPGVGGGDIWFYDDRIVLEFHMPGAGIAETLVFY